MGADPFDMTDSDAEMPEEALSPIKSKFLIKKEPADEPVASSSASAAAVPAVAPKKAGAKSKGAARRLSRHASDPRPPEVIAQQVVALVGKPLKAPAVVYPLKHIDGKPWVSLSEHLLWLRRACSDNGQTRYKACFQSAI